MLAILFCCVLPKEELRFAEEAGVNRIYVHKTSLATPKGNGLDVRLLHSLHVFCHMNVVDGEVSAYGEEVDTCIYLV